jgi:hypothetical protein
MSVAEESEVLLDPRCKGCIPEPIIWPETAPLKKAIEYAERGWNVFPAEVDDNKKKSYKSAEHSNGAKWGMTKDTEQIKRDFRQWPNAGVGIPTGKINGFFVVEADTKKGHGVDGIESLRELEERNSKLPQTLMAASPSGSLHHYYKHPGGDIKVKNSTSELADGVDVRGDGGMVVAPPTKRGSGQYRWLNELEIADAPPWLLDLVVEKPRITVVDGLEERRPPPELARIAYAMDIIPNDKKDMVWKFFDKAAGELKELGGWDGWNTIMMSLWAATNGSNDGCRIARRWCRKNKHYPKNEIAAAKRWEEIASSPPKDLTVGTLFALASFYRKGWQEDFERDMRLPASIYHGDPGADAPMRWLIKNLLPEIDVAWIAGQWGTGKTFVALDVAGSVLPGMPEFFIDYRIKRRGGVLFIAAEGAANLGLRFEVMLAKKLGRSVMDPNPPQPFARVSFQPELLKNGARDLIAIAKRDAEWMRERHGVDLVLIIIDTIAAASAFQDEDKSAQGQLVMNALKELSARSGALVLGVDHFGKDAEKGARGTSAKEGSVDNELALVGKRAVTGRVSDLCMGVRKVREGDSGREIPFRLEVIDCGVDEDGDQITTCVVHWEPDRQQVQSSQDHWRDGNGMVALRQALTLALRDHGRDFHPRDHGVLVRAAPLEQIREGFKLAYPPPPDDDPRKRGKAVAAAFRRAIEKARDAHALIRTEEAGADFWVWEPPDDGPM